VPSKRAVAEIEKYLTDLMEPFKYSMSTKDVTFKLELKLELTEGLLEIWTDFKLYESIFFHLF
jgi:hypothetical protein